MRTVSAPQFAESVSEGDVRWEKSEFSRPLTNRCFTVSCLSLVSLAGVGEYVAEDEVIAEIETDKVSQSSL